MQQPRGKTLSGSVLTLERLNWQAGPCDVCCLTTAQMMMMMMNRNITAFMVSATAQCAFHSGLVVVVVVVTVADTDADADQRRLDDDDDDETKR